ncbi:MAG: guanitoxin biosynthesis heme-dependent pre-guanitoxin N-hydroxylase GntA [Rhizobacter sp.]
MHPPQKPLLRANAQQLTQQFRDYVQSPDFPCVGARSALNRGSARFNTYGGLGRGGDVERLCTDLEEFSAEFAHPGEEPTTFVAMFDDTIDTEAQFEQRMWQHLQDVHEHDRRRFAWDATVSADPASEKFSFSVAGRAFFVVGLSPVASRIARRAPMPCLVFNFHDQFESFRASGKYAGLQKVIRKRDMALQGEINPVLAAHGEASEARQYSGRATEAGWRCPFAPGAAHGS